MYAIISMYCKRTLSLNLFSNIKSHAIILEKRKWRHTIILIQLRERESEICFVILKYCKTAQCT